MPRQELNWAVSQINLHEKYYNEKAAIKAQANSLRIEYRAVLSQLHEFLMDWNLHIYILFFRRNDWQNKKLDISLIRDEYKAVLEDIKEKAPKFYWIGLPEIVILQIKRAIPKLEEEIVNALNEERRPKSNLTELTVNAMLVSAIGAITKEKIRVLGERIKRAFEAPRISIESGAYLVREQRYGNVGYWQASVLRYKRIKYATISQAFKAVDHQIDSELEEIAFLSTCNRLFKRLANSSNEDLLQQIDSLIPKLTNLRVEEKRLAGIVLTYAKEFIATSHQKQLAGTLNLTQQLFIRRIRESKQIIQRLSESRAVYLSQEVDSRDKYLLAKVAKILNSLKNNSRNLTKKMLKEDFFNPEHKAYLYLKEPEFNSLIEPLGRLAEILQKGLVNKAELEQTKAMFNLFLYKIFSSRILNKFMYDYRQYFVQSQLEESAETKTREEAFLKTFLEYYQASNAVGDSPDLYWEIFYQAAFVSSEKKVFIFRHLRLHYPGTDQKSRLPEPKRTYSCQRTTII